MDKKADWKDILKDRRLIGASLAGLGGAVVGGGILPGLIYKKPTTTSRVLLGGSSGLISALVALAAMKGSADEDNPSGIAIAGKNLADTAHNLPDLLSAKRFTAEELRNMSPLSRTLYGHGDNIAAKTVRFIKGGFPDWEGLFGKRQYAIDREKKGELPESPEPSKLLSWGKLGLNATLGGLGGWQHYKNLNRRWLNREAVKRMADMGYAADMTQAIQDPALKLKFQELLRRQNQGGIVTRLKEGLQSAGKTAEGNIKRLKFWGTKSPQKIQGLFNRGQVGMGVWDAIRGGKNTAKDLRAFMTANRPRVSSGRKIWHGVRGLGRSILIMSVLGALESLAGSNQTMYKDTSIDLWKDLANKGK